MTLLTTRFDRYGWLGDQHLAADWLSLWDIYCEQPYWSSFDAKENDAINRFENGLCAAIKQGVLGE